MKKRVMSFLLALALIVGLMPGMSMTAHADNSETLLTTITPTAKEQASYNPENVASVSFSNLPNYSSTYAAIWGWWGYGWSATVNAAEGYTITKCVFYDDKDRTATDSEAPFVVETTEQEKEPRVNGTPILAYQSKGIKKIEVYGYATPTTVGVTGVSLDKTAAQTIDVDGKVSFTATVSPDNATDKKVKWSVGGTDTGAVKLYSDEACTTEVGTDATETLTVYAKGISAGSATVTVTSNADSEKSASCDVTVNEAVPVHTHAEGEPGHGIRFVEWTGDSLPTEAGSYCLMKDVSLSEIWNAPTGTTNLCLNGHTIKWTGSTYKRDVTLLNVGSGASLNLYEHEGQAGKIQGYKSNSGSDGNVTVNGGSFAMYGGTLQGVDKNQSGTGQAVVVKNRGKMTMAGGTIIRYSGNGIAIASGGDVTVTGGVIADNGTGGISVDSNSTLTITGGEITRNETGINIYSSSATVNVSGAPVIDGNVNYMGEKKNLNFRNNETTINITDALTEGAKIGVKRKPGVFTKSTGDVKAKDYISYFSSDDPTYSVLREGDELRLAEPHTHDGITFAPWTTANSLPTEAGSYYLTEDVMIESTWEVPGTVNLCLNGHDIAYAGSTVDSVITVGNGAALNLYDCDTESTGSITGGEGKRVGSNRYGGGVYVDGGAFTMYGGSITGNKASIGAGVCVDSGSFTLNDGSITGNTAVYGGGGVYMAGGTFTMRDGSISENKASNSGGGGVSLLGEVAFTMSGGSITGNTSDPSGGGVYMGNKFATFTMSGGSITGNTATERGGGVSVSGTFNLSGNAKITGNTVKGAANNVCTYDSQFGNSKINVTGELTGTDPIGVTIFRKPGVFTNSTGSVKAKDYVEKFTSDNSAYTVVTEGDELKLSSHEHDFTYVADGATITATCANEDGNCDLTDAKTTLTIAAPTLETYGQTGEGISEKATLTGLTDFNAATEKTVAETEITYIGRDGTTYAESTTAPTDAGKYTAKITLTGVKTSAGEDQSVTATVDYEIEKADPTAVVPTPLTATYGQTLKDVTLSNPEGNTPGTWAFKEAPATSVGNAGDNTFKAVFTPEDTKNYKTVEKDVTISVGKADASATAPTDKAPTYNGSEQEIVNAASTKDGTIYYAVTTENTAPDDNSYSTDIPKATDAGSYYVWYKVIGDANHNDSEPASINASIAKRSVTLTSATTSKEYDGDALTDDTVTVTGDGFVNGEGASYSVTGTQTLPGHSANTFGYTLNQGTKADNYTITKVEGTLTINDREAKYEISPQAKSDTVKYDGQEHTVTGLVTDTFTVDDHTYTVEGLSASGSGTNFGNYQVSVTGTAVVKDSDGNDVTKEFSVQPISGTLTITKRNVTLTSASDSKVYDGDALTNDEVTVSGDGFAAGEGASYNVTGRRLAYGTAENPFSYTLNDGTLADNYNIATSFGTLNVTHRDAKYTVTLTANSGSEKYDGSAKTVSGFTLDADDDKQPDKVTADAETGSITFTASNGKEYTLSGMTASVSATDAGEYTVNITGTPRIVDTEGNDETAEFTVNVESGKLSIGKRSVTLTSATDSKAYDGTALTNSDVTVGGDGFADGDGAHYTFTGSQTLPGDSANAFSYDLNEGTKARNYEIKKTEGTLTITDRTDEGEDKKYEIKVTAKSGEFLYDGSEKTVSGFETLTFNVNGVNYTVEGLSAEAKRTDAGTTAVEVTGTPVVKNADGVDLTKEFIVKTENGSLTINKRSVTLTSATAAKPYDGDALTNDTVTVTGDGFADGEGAHYSFTGAQTLTGSSENTFSYDLNEGTKAGNYEISLAFGTLSVTKSDADAVKAPTGKELTYNGQEQKLADPGSADGGEMQYALGEDADSAPTSGWSISVPGGTDAGTYYVWYRVIGDANHNDTEPECVVSKISHSFEEVAEVPATCETDGVQKHWKDETGKLYKDAEGKEEAAESDLIIKATDHGWAEPSYEWAEDKSTVTARRICNNDADHVETEIVDTISKVTREATESEEGETTYTATFKNPAFTEQTKTESIPKLEPEEVTYSNTKGNGTQWTKGSTSTADFTFKRSINDSETFSHFTGIQVDGKDVAESEYVAEAGSVIVKLKPAYLKTLSIGEHTLTALFDDGNNASAKFTVVPRKASGNRNTTNSTTKKANTVSSTGAPKTGDTSNMLLWLTILCASILVLFNVINVRGKRGFGNRR